MRLPSPAQLFGLSLFALIVISMFSAFSAGIAVSDSGLGRHSYPVSANSIKPGACTGLNLTNVVSGSGTVTGTAGNDLILGGPGNDTIDGLDGDDCILGGGGDDVIDGNTGSDICLGGPGTDTFNACEGQVQ